MSKSSINFKPVKSNSEHHNFRQGPLDYVMEDLSGNNQSWSVDSIQNRTDEIKKHCKEVSGRKLQKNANPIKEAVVNIQPHHTIEDLKTLASELENRFGIQCFQIHIHRDEGKSRDEINHHAHMVFDWQDKSKGTVLNLNQLKMSQIQTLVANTLGMERGELKTNSNRERLEPIEYKRQQEELKLQQLQQQNADLEQKKNEVRARIEDLDRRRAKEALSDTISDLVYNPSVDVKRILSADENDLSRAISILEEEILAIEKQGASPGQK